MISDEIKRFGSLYKNRGIHTLDAVSTALADIFGDTDIDDSYCPDIVQSLIELKELVMKNKHIMCDDDFIRLINTITAAIWDISVYQGKANMSTVFAELDFNTFDSYAAENMEYPISR